MSGFFVVFFLLKSDGRKHQFLLINQGDLIPMFPDPVTISGYGNVLVPSFREQFIHSACVPSASPTHNAEPAALMLDPFFFLFFFFASFYLRDTANHDVGDSLKKEKQTDKAREILQTLTRHQKIKRKKGERERAGKYYIYIKNKKKGSKL